VRDVHANAEVSVERGVAYGHGKLLDIYRPDSGSGPAGGPAPTVLLWHGAGPDERYALAPLAVAAASHGLTVAAFTRRAPTTGSSPIEDLREAGAAPVPFWLAHGTGDVVVDIAASREFAALLTGKGWPVWFEEQPTDHAGIIGAEYDPAAGRVRPAAAAAAVAAGELSARMVAEAAGVLPQAGATG